MHRKESELQLKGMVTLVCGKQFGAKLQSDEENKLQRCLCAWSEVVFQHGKRVTEVEPILRCGAEQRERAQLQ